MERNCCVNEIIRKCHRSASVRLDAASARSHITYQRFASRVDDRDQQGRDGEPSLGILHVKVPESDDSHLLDNEHTSTADHRLDGQEEESHGKVVTRDNELAIVGGI
jgi:hypothetical protein